MSILSKIKRGTAGTPLRFVIAGPEGVGKSTLASKAPAPLFVSAEDGLTGLDHVQRFIPTDLDNLHLLLDELIVSSGEFQTLVIDTTDWLERLISAHVCKRDNMADIEAYGFGKGYVVVEGELVKILNKLDTLRQSQKVGIILLSHVQIKTFQDPRGPSYDRFEMKGHKKFCGLLREWPDALLFATFEVFQTKEKVNGRPREKTIGGERVMHTTWSPAWDAKNRLNLPDELPLEWEALEQAIKENSSESLREQIKKLFATAKLDEKSQAAWAKWIAGIDGFSADKLKQAIEKLTSKQ